MASLPITCGINHYAVHTPEVAAVSSVTINNTY